MLKTISFKQSPMHCGPASLKIVADYFGIKKTEKELARLCKTTMARGTGGYDLVRAAKKIGLEGSVVDHATFAQIQSHLAKGIPVIVNWFSPGQSRPIANQRMAGGHYSVVIDLTKTHIVLEDPGPGRKRKIERKDFMRVWFDYDGPYPKTAKSIHLRRMIVVAPQR